ncbi:ion transport peptide-like isoform X1 [Polistes fuscatus]|uniref:ion transport peptide-like isoform X1 n=1 Tax=Polistes fuscatus TaxID=30207 RepID=UPI001CA89247|nr:ion transport peptide-like isoform X1 [Polistes fuscatus]XP_043496720.1 ion transport peptide-like isoform X1 [Polistes fuscatus]XP_043496721.1 ion transport peptide-like isoform X1 [Polistes fuscatus]XP_043496722.1 ion transport peptide-like isoform X1 [Polistes fuscatus]XP_043496723.1 ion transport peptide-like isoform X1 [Polistes fuscatus]XP_043496725.1 ion transport peptide-like isoform X1 [Polistes fuscatus]
MMMMMMHREQKGQASSRKQSSFSSLGDHSSAMYNRTTTSYQLGLSNSSSSLSSLPSSSSLYSSSSSSSSKTNCPSLLTVLAWTATLLLVSSCLGIADAGVLMSHPLGKRSYLDLSCKGVYDKSIFARLDRICEDCYNLFREPQLHVLCRKNCFTTDYFKGCLEVLLLTDETEKIQMWIKQLHGADPGV